MSDSDVDRGEGEGSPQTELRQRFKTEEDFVDEKEIEAVLIDNESCETVYETAEASDVDEPKVTVCRGIRNLQPLQRPSFITRQFNNIKSFFSEFLEFILLLYDAILNDHFYLLYFYSLTTLFNPMADVNTQVQEHNQRRMAREGRYFSSTNKPKTTSFPGCGPSS